MALIDLALRSFLDTSSADLIGDFFEPALANSVRYDRGVGYFSSGWLRVAARGMSTFAASGGQARWVTSPILDAADWEALITGDAARTDPILKRALERNITDLAETLERDTLSALAWMVADAILNFKIALPQNKLEMGNFHDKFGVFTDIEGSRVSFNGSYLDFVNNMPQNNTIRLKAASKYLVILAALLVFMGWMRSTPPGLLGKADAVGCAVCHRIDARSFHIGSRQLPLCARCSGMYLGALRGGYINTLVTDSITAKELLCMD